MHVTRQRRKEGLLSKNSDTVKLFWISPSFLVRILLAGGSSVTTVVIIVVLMTAAVFIEILGHSKPWVTTTAALSHGVKPNLIHESIFGSVQQRR